jgi:hypothetical protein
MNALDLTRALEATEPAPAPKPAPLGSLLAIDDCALAMARKFGAIDADGVLWCIRCNQRHGSLPHLCCGICLAEYRRGHR